MAEWLSNNWSQIAISGVAFVATAVVGLWLRRVVFSVFVFWVAKRKWEGARIVIGATRSPFLFWFLLLGAHIAVQVSALSSQAKSLSALIIASLFVLSVAWTLATLADQLLRLYMPRASVSRRATNITANVIRVTVLVVAVLVILEIWHMPTTPVLLLVVLAAVAAFIALRHALPDLFAGLQLSATPRFAVGDYVKLETGEEGYVEESGWHATLIRGLDGSTVAIPNSRIVQGTVTNYGHPLKRAEEPFRFYTRINVSELTGISARNLTELLTSLRQASDAMIYYHTHHFLEEHHYLTPEPANDFAVWVTDAIGDEVLGEQLASLDTFSFPNPGSLRERLIGIIEEHLAARPNHSREVEPGREFHFMKSVSAIMDTPLRAHDLREFVEALRKVSLNSLYFHMFESRLRLARGQNDFSAWLADSLDEAELGREIARLDPYTYSLEGLRSTLVQLIEKRIK